MTKSDTDQNLTLLMLFKFCFNSSLYFTNFKLSLILDFSIFSLISNSNIDFFNVKIQPYPPRARFSGGKTICSKTAHEGGSRTYDCIDFFTNFKVQILLFLDFSIFSLFSKYRFQSSTFINSGFLDFLLISNINFSLISKFNFY